MRVDEDGRRLRPFPRTAADGSASIRSPRSSGRIDVEPPPSSLIRVQDAEVMFRIGHRAHRSRRHSGGIGTAFSARRTDADRAPRRSDDFSPPPRRWPHVDRRRGWNHRPTFGWGVGGCVAPAGSPNVRAVPPMSIVMMSRSVSCRRKARTPPRTKRERHRYAGLARR